MPRPAAPLPATNGWGSTLALLTPFFILSWLLAPSRRRRITGWVLAAVGVVPLAISTNRGVWLSIGLGLVYFAFRQARAGRRPPAARGRRRRRPRGDGGDVHPALEHRVGPPQRDRGEQHHARGRLQARVGEDAGVAGPRLRRTRVGRPLPADRHPRPDLVRDVLPRVPGAGAARSSRCSRCSSPRYRARTPAALWAHICIFMAITQLPYYGLLPQFVLVGIAAGICWRENHPEAVEAR